MVAGALRHDHDRMAAIQNALFQSRQEPATAFEGKGHLCNQSEVHVLTRDGGAGGDEARVTPHQLNERDAVMHAAGFCVCGIDDAAGLFERGEIAERARDVTYIVADGLRDAHDREKITALSAGLVQSVCAASRAIPPMQNSMSTSRLIRFSTAASISIVPREVPSTRRTPSPRASPLAGRAHCSSKKTPADDCE